MSQGKQEAAPSIGGSKKLGSWLGSKVGALGEHVKEVRDTTKLKVTDVTETVQKDLHKVRKAGQELKTKMQSGSRSLCSAAVRDRGWEVNAGMLAVGNEGIRLKPQMLVGARVGNFSAEAGLRDVRDGICMVAKAEAAMAVEATGHSIAELHETIKVDTIGFREALDITKRIFSSSAGRIAKALGVSKEELESNLEGETECIEPGYRPMSLKVEVELSDGGEMTICLGWTDTQGYRMVGSGMELDSGMVAGYKLFAGRHKSKETAKIIIGVNNFTFQYIIPLRRIGTPCAHCGGIGKKGIGTNAQKELTQFSCKSCEGKGYQKS
jgi:hypothetical protein